MPFIVPSSYLPEAYATLGIAIEQLPHNEKLSFKTYPGLDKAVLNYKLTYEDHVFEDEQQATLELEIASRLLHGKDYNYSISQPQAHIAQLACSKAKVDPFRPTVPTPEPITFSFLRRDGLAMKARCRAKDVSAENAKKLLDSLTFSM